MNKQNIIDNKKVYNTLNSEKTYGELYINEILDKALELNGISEAEVLALLDNKNPSMELKIFSVANIIKKTIYGNRLVLFAPLYISNLCKNICLYCAFSKNNTDIARQVLNQDEIKDETEQLLKEGQKRILLVAGEAYPKEGLKYIFNSIKTIYDTTTKDGNIKRINVNIAPLSTGDFKELYKCNIGTYQLFQETYHEETYKKMHITGPKSDYNYRLEAINRAFNAGFKDIGIGVLFGLYDFRYEVLALLAHIKYLEKYFGMGPHTISVPRIEPAASSYLSRHVPYPVNDYEFKKIIAVLRIAVPYTGIILSTRENSLLRREALSLGVSQISAGSRTNPGGYSCNTKKIISEEQFSLGDTRSLREVIIDLVEERHIPSFCTGCYRLGRVGKDFMDLAKPGLIKEHCLPNAIFTFTEYLNNFANDDLRKKGFNLINETLDKEIVNQKLKKIINNNILKINNGAKDIYL